MWLLSLAWLTLLRVTSTIQSKGQTESPVPLTSSAPAPSLEAFYPTIVSEPVDQSATTVTEGNQTSNSSISASAASEAEDEYYQAYQDYPDPINSSGSLLPAPEISRVHVNPDNDVTRPISRTVEINNDEEEEISLPEDSLADTDLHDHDLIDSVMYIYYGGGGSGSVGGRPGTSGGGTGLLRSGMSDAAGESPFRVPLTVQPPHNIQVVIVGAVVALVAQFLTLASALRRIWSNDPSLLVLLNTEIALTLTNLLFMLGVQATSDQQNCALVAIGLHFLHLVTAATFMGTSGYSYARLVGRDNKSLLAICIVGPWMFPAPAIYFCTHVNLQFYELHNYCWLTLDKGFLEIFLLPICLMVLTTTVLAFLGLKPSVLRSDKRSASSLPPPEMPPPMVNGDVAVGAPSLKDVLRRDLRLSAILLPSFSVVWCLSLLALSNAKSLLFPLLFVAINAFLNWFVYIWWLPGEGSSWRSDGDLEDIEEDLEEDLLFDEPVTTKDDQALLQDYFVGKRIFYEPAIEPIATISS